jgi:hypothetical protein
MVGMALDAGGDRKDESDPRLLGHLRQFFNYVSC